jgi:molybdate transport system substrate-binding protein
MRVGPIAAALGLLSLALVGSAEAAKTHVAVAANFTEPARAIAALFHEKTGHDAVLIFGASGAFLTQISHDAPFEVFLSADEERPRLAVEQGYAVADSRFTYVCSGAGS